MPKDRSYGDRGTGYTPRIDRKIGRGTRWCKRCGDYTAVIQKYDPKIGILGLEVSTSLARPGFNIKLRSKRKTKVGKNHRIRKNDAIKFLTEEFGVKVV